MKTPPRAKIKPRTAFVGLGSNLGYRRKNIAEALRRIQGHPRITVTKTSPLYQTEAVGTGPQRDYLNAVIKIKTTLTPENLLRALAQVEARMGRRRKKKWAPRVIDLDILAMGPTIWRSRRLTVPHPRYHQRRFVLIPFCRLAPNFVHPVLKRRNAALLAQLTPQDQRVTMIGTWTKSPSQLSKKRRKPKHPSPR